jgi:hypothetical protein
VRGQADKKVLAKHLLGSMAGESGGVISSEPKVIAMGFAPALISFRFVGTGKSGKRTSRLSRDERSLSTLINVPAV